MKTKITKTLFITILSITIFASCSKNEDIAIQPEQATALEQPDDTNKLCGFVDGNWNATAVLSTTIGTTDETNFMNAQNARIASLWGRPAVSLRFVKDPSNPNSTFNAISYSSRKIYYGEAIYKAAKVKGQIVNAMVLAHEFGHQLQYTYNLPSKDEKTARASELEADGMAGYYLRKPNGYNATSFNAIAAAYNFAASIGDNAVNSPNHHGSSAQRRSAVRLGFLLAAPQNGNLSATDFDYNFFYYYNGVLNGTYKSASLPAGLNPTIDDLIRAHAQELQKIASGEITQEQFENLD
jgi:uncharacterized protein